METEPSSSLPVSSSEKVIDDANISQLTAEEKAAKRTQIIIIAVVIVFVALLVTAIVLMAKFPAATVVVRDIAIVFVAVTTFLMGLAMILLIFQIQVLIQVLRDEIQPLLRSVNDTASTVRGTTAFVSHNVVSPIIKVAGFTAGARQVFSDALAVVKAARPYRSKKNDTE